MGRGREEVISFANFALKMVLFQTLNHNYFVVSGLECKTGPGVILDSYWSLIFLILLFQVSDYQKCSGGRSEGFFLLNTRKTRDKGGSKFY